MRTIRAAILVLLLLAAVLAACRAEFQVFIYNDGAKDVVVTPEHNPALRVTVPIGKTRSLGSVPPGIDVANYIVKSVSGDPRGCLYIAIYSRNESFTLPLHYIEPCGGHGRAGEP